MHVIIIGAGKVGYSLAQKLSNEKLDIFLIDNDETRLQPVDENLDIQTILGEGSKMSVLQEAGVEKADLLLAVTNSEEVNILACLLGRQAGVNRTVARVSSPEYVANGKFNNSSFDIDLMINPEMVTAEAILKLVQVPEALNVEYMADRKVQLVELYVDEKSPIINKTLDELDFQHPYLIVAIVRNGKIVIPGGSDYIKAGDLIFVMAKTHEMLAIEEFLGQKRFKVKDIAILGGGKLGYQVARILEKRDLNIKIIEKNYEKCQELSTRLDRTEIIHGDGTDLAILENEDIEKSDILLTLTGDDKVNILVSLLAKHLGVNKTIAQLRRSDYVPILEKLGIDVAVSPRMLTAAGIMKFIRRGKILSVTFLEGDRAELLEFMAPEKGRIIQKTLNHTKLPRGMIVGAICRGDSVIVPTGDDKIRPGDRVIIFALSETVNKVEDIFSGR